MPDTYDTSLTPLSGSKSLKVTRRVVDKSNGDSALKIPVKAVVENNDKISPICHNLNVDTYRVARTIRISLPINKGRMAIIGLLIVLE